MINVNGQLVEAVKVDGKLVELLHSVKLGNSHVSVEIQPLRKDKNTDIVFEVGEPIEAFGGFKREKDFVYAVAERVALQNAVSHIRN